ncbi:uncharacterized protein LOC103518358 [Diaphorina citri]|uniref:Uncharacterized protein LOC103518358 n=1 Tax=Diaphorina citri TaxID=121845 RepID=A0A3Q0JC16_DIACI|nr:uncharacterized protein LOC103518358 [Diaphorina citri]
MSGPPPLEANGSTSTRTTTTTTQSVFNFGAPDFSHIFRTSKFTKETAIVNSSEDKTSLVKDSLFSSKTTRLTSSKFSLLSNSADGSVGSSENDLNTEAKLLEKAIQTNDIVRVKRILNLHRDKFQVHAHNSLNNQGDSCETQSRDVEILLTKSKNLIQKIESGGYYSSSSSSSSSLLSPHPLLPLIFSNALHVAVDAGSVDVVRLLLKYGLEPNQGGRLPGHTLDETQAPPLPPVGRASSKPNSPKVAPGAPKTNKLQKDSPPPRKPKL